MGMQAPGAWLDQTDRTPHKVAQEELQLLAASTEPRRKSSCKELEAKQHHHLGHGAQRAAGMRERGA